MNRLILERIIYTAVIILCLVVLTFLAFSGSLVTNTQVIYQGF